MKSCILTYHSLDASGSVISVSPEVFREHMDFLSNAETKVVPLEQIRDSPGAVALTFDDAFHNFYEYAFPVLQKHGFPATVFVVTGFCGRKNLWPSQPAHPRIPALALMTWSELQEVGRAGVRLGSHTCTHPHLPQLSESEIEEELRISQNSLQDRIGQKVTTFAYPYGASSPRVRQTVQRHFELACGTKLAYISQDSDAAELPRLDAYYLRNQMWFKGLSRQYGSAYIEVRRFLRDLRGLGSRP